MKLKLLISILCFLIAGYVLFFPVFERHRDPLKNVQTRGLILPPRVIALLALEFRTVTADFLFARASQYFGGKIDKRELLTSSDLGWLYNNLLVITTLDPYFEDPYYFANGIFTWETGRYNEANALLQRGSDARAWDWQLPFYIGFNKFYFLHDNKGGADYLLVAAKRPGAWPYLPTLAARLYNNADRTESAIDILTVFWENANDERVKKEYEVRIEALKGILFLGRAVNSYKRKTGRQPKGLDLLIQAGIIAEIPKDPYGGSYYLDNDGSVKTTSKLAFKPKPSEKIAQ